MCIGWGVAIAIVTAANLYYSWRVSQAELMEEHSRPIHIEGKDGTKVTIE